MRRVAVIANRGRHGAGSPTARCLAPRIAPVPPDPSLPPRRRSRLGLYGPFLALALIAAAWSVGWVLIRSRTVAGLDAWMEAEGRAGRRWTCADRTVGGYPFRIELGCASLSLARPDVTLALGRLGVVAQIYRPGHVIAELAGPLRLAAGTVTAEASWQLLRTSIVLSGRDLDRAAVTAEAPRVILETPSLGRVPLASVRLEAHLRPDPARPAAWDLAVRAPGAVLPGLDALVGGTEPADLDLILAITEARVLPARPLPAEFERWREAGGRVEIDRLAVAKGPRRLEGKGSLGLDLAHRPSGVLQLAGAQLGGVLGGLFGPRIGGVLGAVLGAPRPAPEAPADPSGAKLRALPPLRLEDGRVHVGPIAIPGLVIPRPY